MNLQFTAWPEMLSFPYLLNNGFSLYQDMVHPYPPLLTIMLSQVYEIFGYSVTALKIFTWVLILVNDMFIWLIVHKLTKSQAAAFASVLFYILVQPFLEGNMMWVDLGFVPFVLSGMYFMLQGETLLFRVSPCNRLILSGLLFTLAAFVKQTAGLFLVMAVIALFFDKRFKEVPYLLMAPLFMSSLFILKLYAIGDLEHFLNWTLVFPSTFWTTFPGYVDMAIDRRSVLILFILFMPSILFLIFERSFIKNKSIRLMATFLLVSLVVVYPRFSFFHLQSALAFITIFMGITFGYRKQYAVFAVVFLLLYPLVHKPVLAINWGKPDRFNSATEHEFADRIADTVPKDTTLYLLNLHSGYYVFADRLPPKPWVDNYGWYFEVPGVQESVISKWEEKPPEYILWKEKEVGAWFELGTYEPQMIIKWISENYTREIELEKGTWLWQNVDN